MFAWLGRCSWWSAQHLMQAQRMPGRRGPARRAGCAAWGSASSGAETSKTVSLWWTLPAIIRWHATCSHRAVEWRGISNTPNKKLTHRAAGKAFREMLEAVSFRKELMLSIHRDSEGLLWNDQVSNLVLQVPVRCAMGWHGHASPLYRQRPNKHPPAFHDYFSILNMHAGHAADL